MNYGKLMRSGLSLLLAGLAACEYQFNQDGGVMHYSFGNASSQSVASISGGNSVIVINGDTVRIRGGTLSVNGISYGSVAEEDRIEYRVQNGTKNLTVNGIARHPAKNSG
jgi:hypothetical protein